MKKYIKNMIEEIEILQQHINDAVDENFGSCPDYNWFDDLLNRRNVLLDQLKNFSPDEYIKVIDAF